MKIISIDPGYERVGIAILEKNPRDKKETVVYSECFKTSAKLPFQERLLLIGEHLEKIIKKYKPKTMAIEKLFFENNQKTAMGVSEARGAIIYVCKKNKMEVFEYTPLQIKSAVTGYGKADKGMVMDMVPKLVFMKKETKSDDELDAVAIGITCIASEKLS